MTSKPYLAVVKIRSGINANGKTRGILQRLMLTRKLTCVVFKNNPELQGQLKQVKDFTTYGEIDESFLAKLIEKRGKEYKGRLEDSHKKIKYDKFITYKKKHYNRQFHLHPPVGGFERKGIKVGFNQGGALGNRGEKIVELLEKML